MNKIKTLIPYTNSKGEFLIAKVEDDFKYFIGSIDLKQLFLVGYDFSIPLPPGNWQIVDESEAVEQKENLVYFIEDMETHKWYRNTIGLHPTLHTFGSGWDKPHLQDEDYWTINPQEAYHFSTISDAESLLQTGMEKVGNPKQFTKFPHFSNAANEPKKLEVTEHIFYGSHLESYQSLLTSLGITGKAIILKLKK